MILGSYYSSQDNDGEDGDNWYQSNIGSEYETKRVFAFSMIEQFQLVKPWKPQQWNSLCVLHQTNQYSLHLNDNNILRHFYGDNSNNSISSLYDVMFGPFFGAIADLQIWKRSFTNREITDFNECKLNSEGDFYQWNPSDFTLNDHIDIEDLDGEEYCPKPPEIAMISNGKPSPFDAIIEFCKGVFRSRMAVGKDLTSLEAMKKAFSTSSCPAKSYFYTGHVSDKNGRFLDVYDQQPLNFRIAEISLNQHHKFLKNVFFLKLISTGINASWREGQPNNFGGSQDCVYCMQDSSLVGDIECSLNLCPLCQVEIGTVFQFSGVCQEVPLDVLYILQVTNVNSNQRSSMKLIVGGLTDWVRDQLPVLFS